MGFFRKIVIVFSWNISILSFPIRGKVR